MLVVEYASEHLIHVISVVITGSMFLNNRGYRVAALLEMGPKVSLRDEDILPGEDPFLEITLDDRPKGFNRVQFRRIWRHKHEFVSGIQLLRALLL